MHYLNLPSKPGIPVSTCYGPRYYSDMRFFIKKGSRCIYEGQVVRLITCSDSGKIPGVITVGGNSDYVSVTLESLLEGKSTYETVNSSTVLIDDITPVDKSFKV